MAPSITPPLEPGPPAQPDAGREDPLSDFPAEADLRRAASASRLLKGLIVAGFGLVALLVVVFALQRPRDGQRAAGHQETAAHGTVRIESNPPGARVWSAGRDLGLTPVSFPMPPGTHTVVLRQGDLARSLSLQITAGMQVVHHVELVRAPRAGALHVETTPPGARVFLDGILRGTSPLDL
ncbi:MAG TPA: PEGA domain-containing protein, partial [Vicinamibacterales bacterium]|nr:PEGA domain-containing protein [Vicinamibacterales bacterium]